MIFHIPVMDFMHTSECNLRCKYCFEEKESKKNLKFEEIRPYLEQGGTLSFFLFGGEPLMNPDFLRDFFEFIEGLDISKHIRDKLTKSASRLITNGTLLEKNIDLIKKHKLEVQISIDGPKEINDINRIRVNGRGSYDDIMRNVELCNDKGIDFTFHGVVNRETVPYIRDISVWFLEMTAKYYGIEKGIDVMKMNCFQIVFEEDYTDEDVDIFLDQVVRFCEYVWENEDFTLKQKKKTIANYLYKQGGVCGAGTSLLAVDTSMNIYPCHRQADNSEIDKESFKMGNVYDTEGLGNFKVYNSFYNVGRLHRRMYSYKLLNNNFREFHNWLNWCPSTNVYTSGANNPYYISSKYNVLMIELKRLSKQLMIHYNIDRSLTVDGKRK